MEHAKHAERFLVDILPAIDEFNRHLILPDFGRTTSVFNQIKRVDLKDHGLYELVIGGIPLRIKGDMRQFEERYDALLQEMHRVERKYAVQVTPAYYVSDHHEQTGPAVELVFDHKRILATIGEHYLLIHWNERNLPYLPAKSLGQWYPGSFGATDEYSRCLRFSPQTRTGEFEHTQAKLFEFLLRQEADRYIIDAPVKVDRKHLVLVEETNRDELERRARHHLPSTRPQYHLARFLNMVG